MLRLYIDEDAMSRALIRGLRARGINVSTPLDEDRIGQTDYEQLEFATRMGRVFYTFNVGDFCRLHRDYLAKQKPHAGIIVVYRQRYTVGEQIRRLSKLAEEKSAKEMKNQLLFL